MPFVIEESGTPIVANSEVYFLSCLINILESPSAFTARRLRAKLYVDDVEIPLRNAEWSVDDSRPAGNLTLELARLSDRTAFTRTAIIRLEVEEYLTGVWTLVKTYCDGSILASSAYNFANDGNNPNDTFSVTVLPLLQQRLDTTTDQIVVLYDPDKTTVDETQLELVPNIDGTVGTATVTAIAGMHLGDVLDWVATEMGFDGCHKHVNYEKWPQPRVDFPAGQTLWSTVAGIIGNHNPKLSVTADNYLVVRDGTLNDFTTARTMTLSNFETFQRNATIERFKGIKLDRQLRSDTWDYYELRQENEYQWYGGVPGQYPMTYVVTWYQDFYQNAFPTVPVMSATFSVRQLEYASATELISASAERFSYQFGQGGTRPTRHEVKEWGVSKVPQSWATYQALLPGPNIEFSGAFGGPEDSYTSASDDTFVETFALLKANQTDYTYFGMRDQAESVYTGQTDTRTKGLITIDSDNQMLGEDFQQPMAVAQESGNLAEGQGSAWVETERRKEAQRTEKKKRQVNIRTRRHTALNSTNGMIAENYHDRRIGDIGESEIQTETKPVYITEGADATATLYRNVNGGDAPMILLNPLCLRLNAQQYLPYGSAGKLPTYDATMDLGLVFDPRVDGRTATSVGIYEVTGYTDKISGLEDGGFSTSITSSKQIAEPSATPGDTLVFPTESDILGSQLFKSGAAVVIEKTIRCFDGYEISLGVIANIAVELKHDDDVGYTNIETTPYDVSAFAGTDQVFQFRFTPGAVAGVYSFKFTYGPA